MSNQRYQNVVSFKLSNDAAQKQYARTQDKNALIADSAYIAAKLLIDEIAIATNRAKPVAAGMAAFQHLIKGAVDQHVTQMREPDHSHDTHHDYFDDLKPYIAKHVQLHAQRVGLDEAVKPALRMLGLI